MIFTSHFANAQAYDTLSNFGSYWKYLDDGTNLDAVNWKVLSYVDGTWGCGPAPLGYGDTWIATCISSGCTAQVNCYLPSTCSVLATDYFRRKINVTSVALYDSVVVDGTVDDGMVLYVNGTLEWNYGMPATFDHTTWSTNSISGAAETTLVHNVIPITDFVNGNNEIAVELHQRAANTSDATLDLRFMFRRRSSTGINLLASQENIVFYPNPSENQFTIENKSGNDGAYEISFYDVTGRCVAHQNGMLIDGKSDVHHNLNNGTYLVRIKSEKINSNFTIQVNN